MNFNVTFSESQSAFGTDFDKMQNVGKDGATFTPSVSPDGELSWTNDGNRENPAPVNVKGDNAPEVQYQYSADNAAWHDDYAATDVYDRVSTDGGTTWSAGRLIRGDPGAKGDPGDTGAVYTPTIDDNGNISWTNNGDLPNPAPVNVKGNPGAKGDPGTPGSDANVIADNVNAAFAAATDEQKAAARASIDVTADTGVVSPWYGGIDLTQKFAAEIAGYSDVWAWIKARIAAHDYTGIHINDYIPFVTTNNVTVKACVAGIDTYYRYGDIQVGHHIDFISRDCWPATVQMNNTNYNNGLIPVEKLSGDGTTTAFAMTRKMTAIDNIKVNNTQVTEFTYDFATSTVTFDTAPAYGANIVVTGAGSKHPWLSCKAYAYLNSLAMQVPNGSNANPAITQVDYTANGVYYYLPTALKSVIVEKRILLPTRYSASGTLITSDNIWAWANMGKLWLPSEVEITGCPIWGDKEYGAGGFVQYPVFACNMNRLKALGNGGPIYPWWTISARSGNSTLFVNVDIYGHMNSNASFSGIGAPVCFRIDDSTAA